ncbi:MAG: hypothetical protein KF784_05420 [Fimbriimonadaceae bacterium]|nr:hypothetical protein [Fimbriimonadaceae bacterium]
MDVRTIAAVDPGSAKCGVALVRREADGSITLVERAIVPPDQLADKLAELHESEPFSMVVVGSGTRSRPLVHELRERMPSMGILVVDEKDTTLQARERYWQHHKRKGWRRLLPSTLQSPPDPVDDFVAVILAERVLLG